MPFDPLEDIDIDDGLEDGLGDASADFESAETASIQSGYITYVPWRAWRVLSRASRDGLRRSSGEMLKALRGYSPARLAAEGSGYRAWRT